MRRQITPLVLIAFLSSTIWISCTVSTLDSQGNAEVFRVRNLNLQEMSRTMNIDLYRTRNLELTELQRTMNADVWRLRNLQLLEITGYISPETYVLHIQSFPMTGVDISYSGDYSGTGITNFDVGPKNSPFIITLTAPLTYLDYTFDHWELDGEDVGNNNSIDIIVGDEKRIRTIVAIYSFSASKLEETLKRFKMYKEMYTIFLECYLNSGWWHELALGRANAADVYDPFKELVENFLSTWMDYFEVAYDLPISPISHMLLLKDLSLSLINVYNLFLSIYLEYVSSFMGSTNLGMNFIFTDSLYETRDEIDAIINALDKQNYENFKTALKDLRQLIEKTFEYSKRFDDAYYDNIQFYLIELPLSTKANVYYGLRPHLIAFRELLMLMYIDITHLQGKPESLAQNKPAGVLTPRPNKPIVTEFYWEVNGVKITQAKKGQTVTAHVIIRTTNISTIEHDKVEGKVNVILKKDVAFWWDSTVKTAYFEVSEKILKPGKTIDLTLSFVPDEASSLTLRGYYVEVTFSGQYLYSDNKLSDIPVSWDDGSVGTMKNSYPPRLRVSETSRTTLSSGTVVVLKETQHRLYLHVYDENNKHIGLNYETGMVETQIPNSNYYDLDNGTVIIVMPENITSFKTVVDAKYAQEDNESYELTIITIKNYEAVNQKVVTDNISMGTKHVYTISITQEGEGNIIKNEEANIPLPNPEVNILSHSGWLDSVGYYHISGEVENAGSVPASFVKILATFYDSAGEVVATSFTYTHLSVLLPARKSPFEILLTDTTQAAKVHHYSLGITFSATSPIPLGLEILSHSSYVDDVGFMHVVGEIKSIATGMATYVKIAATFYNVTGHVVATAFTYSDPSNLNPGQIAPFEVLLVYTNRVPLIASYELTVESTQYALISEFSSTIIQSLFMLLNFFTIFAVKILVKNKTVKLRA